MPNPHRQPLAELPLSLFLRPTANSTPASLLNQPHKRPLDLSPSKDRGTPAKRRMLDSGKPEPAVARKLFLDALAAQDRPATPPTASPSRLMPSPPIAARPPPPSPGLVTPNNPPSLHTPPTPRPHHAYHLPPPSPGPAPEDEDKENRPPRRRSLVETPRSALGERHLASLVETAKKGKERERTPREKEEAKREMMREVDEREGVDDEDEEM